MYNTCLAIFFCCINTSAPQTEQPIPVQTHPQVNSTQNQDNNQTLSTNFTNSATQTEPITGKHKKNNRRPQSFPVLFHMIPTAVIKPLACAQAFNLSDNEIQEIDAPNNIITATPCILDLDFTISYQKHLATQQRQKKINQKNALQQTSTQMQPLHQIINPHQNIQHANMQYDRINQQVIPYYPQNRPVYYQYPQPMYQQYQYTQQLYYYPNAMPMNESMLYVQRPQQQNPRILHQNIRK